jgi:CRISPR-associated protein Csm5
MEFMQIKSITISTLSPVHIGCGIDYEPTNYVMDGDCLYPFPWIDEAAFATEEQLRNLLVQAGSIQGLWNIFHSETHLNTMKSLAGRFLPMKSGLKKQQDQRIQKMQFPLIIERTAFDPISDLPILPGTGLKGAIRTALLEYFAQQKNFPGAANAFRNGQVQENLMGGSFASDPLRLLKISDAMLDVNCSEPTRILSKQSRHRKDNSVTSVRDATQNFPECIEPFLAQAFRSELTILENCNTWLEAEQRRQVRNISFDQIALACNTFYQERLEAHREMLKTTECDAWYEQIMPLVTQAIQEKRGFLLRIGKYAGADYLALKQYRRIKTKYEKNPTAHTLPISSNRCHDGQKAYPFGWIFVEVDQDKSGAATPLQVGLRKLRAQHTDRNLAVQRKQEFLNLCKDTQVRLVVQKASIAVKAEESKRHQIAQKAAKRADEERETARQAALASMTPNQQQIEAFKSAFAARAEQLRGNKESMNGDFHNRARKIAQDALAATDWSSEEKRALADAIAEWLPKVVQGMDKDQLKKLKLSALRGLV